MLLSQAGRRLVHTTSALGLMGTLVVFVCSLFIVSTPATASAAVTKSYTYTCTGPMLAETARTLTVGLSAPDTATAGQSLTLTVNLPALTLATAPTATTVQANLSVTPTGGTVSDAGAKPGPVVTANQTAVPAGSITYQVAVTAGTTTPVTIKPTTLTLALANAASTTASCTTTSAEVLSIPIGTGGGDGGDGADGVVRYSCNLASTATDDTIVDIKVVMTPPTSAAANADASITWTGTFEADSNPLMAPTGWPATGAKLFATIKATGAGAPATATGEGTFTTNVAAGAEITQLPSVTIKVKPTTTGTVSLTAGDLAFGTTSAAALVKCTAPTTGLKAYTFTVGNGTGTPTPTPTPTPTNTTPRPTTTHTSTVTVTPSRSNTTRSSETPKAGADTGAGGMMGPDGRLFILTGTALVGAAAVGGLVMRRRSIKG
ncbi:hypothetical protein ACWEPC_30490 [Nonomuraea sp. NPDC004297]